MAPKTIRLLVVDDSKLYRAHLRQLLASSPDIEIVAEAANGDEAVRLTRQVSPDFILMDVIMPVKDGITAIREILAERAVPILVLTAADAGRDGTDLRVFEALQAGALDVLPKPRAGDANAFDSLREDLPRKIRTLSRIRVLTSPPPPQPRSTPLFVVGASTGGPQAINTILRRLPASFAGTILVVQHISHGFLEGLVQWLGRECPLDISVATHRGALERGNVYFAPTQQHLAIQGHSMVLTDEAPRNGCRPAADVLFSSAALAAPRTVGIVLTGMGSDGLEGARDLVRRGGTVLVQTPTSCAVDGMPSAVIDAGHATQVLELEAIAAEMLRLTGR